MHWSASTAISHVHDFKGLHYIFGNLQSLSFWTREISSVVAFSVYDMLSQIPLGLLHNEGHLDSQLSTTVDSRASYLNEF